MNRPEKPHYSGLDLVFSDYFEDLEKYCDVIEQRKDYLFKYSNELENKLILKEKRIAILEKALDNACDMLETYDLANKELTREKNTKEEWKKWCIEK